MIEVFKILQGIYDKDVTDGILHLAQNNRTRGHSWKPLNLFSVNIHVHQKPSFAIFREGIRLGLVYRVRVSFR